MTLRAIAGLALLNGALLGVGGAMLWGLGAVRWWTDLVRLGGVAHLLGVAATMIALTLQLVVGIQVTGASGALTLVVLACAGAGIGVARGRQRPGLVPGWQLPRVSPFVAVLVAGFVVYFEALFRAARLSSILPEWDGWWFWVPKAKAIYFFGELDPDLLSQIANPSYPPGLPVVHALAFGAMGSADETTLHVQYWFYAVGFAAAVAGLLAPRVRQAIWVPLLVLIFLAPSFLTRMTWTYADVPLGYLVTVAALLVILWIDDARPWQLHAAMALLGGAMLTKREGVLFALAVLLAALVATRARRRELWPRLIVTLVAAFGLALSWRVWLVANGLPGDGPAGGYLGLFDHLGRAWPSLELVVETLIDRDLWLVVPLLSFVAIAFAAVARERTLWVFAASFTAAFVCVATWTIWADPTLPFTQDDARNPIVRLTGTAILVLGTLTPLLLEHVWTRSGDLRGSVGGLAARASHLMFRPRPAAWAIVVVAAVGYPGSMLVGSSRMTLPGGFSSFPGGTDCVSEHVRGEPARIVFAYAAAYPEAQDVQRRVRAAGLRDAEVVQDGCGRLRVFADVEAEAVAELIETARTARLEASLEARSGKGTR